MALCTSTVLKQAEGLGMHTEKNAVSLAEWDRDSQSPHLLSNARKTTQIIPLEKDLSFAYRVETVYKFLIPWH